MTRAETAVTPTATALDDDDNAANAILYGFMTVTCFLGPWITNLLGFRWTLRIWALMNLMVAGIAIMGIKPRIPLPRYSHGQARPRILPTRNDFLNSPLFWTFVRSCHLNHNSTLNYLSVRLSSLSFNH